MPPAITFGRFTTHNRQS